MLRRADGTRGRGRSIELGGKKRVRGAERRKNCDLRLTPGCVVKDWRKGYSVTAQNYTTILGTWNKVNLGEFHSREVGWPVSSLVRARC